MTVPQAGSTLLRDCVRKGRRAAGSSWKAAAGAGAGADPDDGVKAAAELQQQLRPAGACYKTVSWKAVGLQDPGPMQRCCCLEGQQQ